jgi:hypothetical protein
MSEPLTAGDLDWLRRRFGSVPPERGHPQGGTLEGVIARLLATLDAAPAAVPEGLREAAERAGFALSLALGATLRRPDVAG